MKRAIVLSGGGGKGAYQIGVWKALKKCHISYSIVTGTSVGALNGAMMTQKDYWRAYYLWKHMNFHYFFDEPISYDLTTLKGKKNLWKLYLKHILDGGLDVSRLEQLLRKVIQPSKFYQSNIEYGMVTFNLSTLKPMMLQKSEIKESLLVDYLMASATCYPAFKQKKIAGEFYIDGGYFDNLPINLAVSMGASEIIAVDLKAVGIKQKLKDKNVQVTRIQPRHKLQSFLVFDAKSSRQAMRFGYLDAMKTFHALDGNRYTFKKNTLEKRFREIQPVFQEKLQSFLAFNSEENSLVEQLLLTLNYRKIIHSNRQYQYETYLKLLDYVGDAFTFDPTKIYTIAQFRKKALTILKTIPVVTMDKIKKQDVTIKELFHRQTIIRYFYEHIKESKTICQQKELAKLALLFSKEFIIAFYLQLEI